MLIKLFNVPYVKCRARADASNPYKLKETFSSEEIHGPSPRAWTSLKQSAKDIWYSPRRPPKTGTTAKQGQQYWLQGLIQFEATISGYLIESYMPASQIFTNTSGGFLCRKQRIQYENDFKWFSLFLFVPLLLIRIESLPTLATTLDIFSR